MMLSDSAIRERMAKGDIVITPFFEKCLGSNSYDIHLSRKVLTYQGFSLDFRTPNETNEILIPRNGMILLPGQLYLCSSIEYTETHNLVSFCEGKSSVGRLGVSVHQTAGKGDIGFCGHWTLEITVVHPVRVYAGMPIAQLIFFETAGECQRPYSRKEDAKYAGQEASPVASRFYKNDWTEFEKIIFDSNDEV